MVQAQKQNSFLERAAWLTGANLLAFALSFLTPLIVVRLFTRTDFGTYKQLFQILSTFMTVFYLQIPSSAYYFMPREPDKRLQVAMNIILFYLVVGSVAMIAFAVFPNWSGPIFHNPALDGFIPMLGVALTLWLIGTNVEIFPLVLGDVRTASAFIVLSQISKSLVLIAAALIFGSLRAMVWASIIQGTIQCAFMLGYIHFRIGSLAVRPDRLFDWKLMKKQLSNSLPYGGGGMAQSLQVDLHNYFVSHFFSAASFAVYANGCFQMPLTYLLQGSFRDALTPEVARLEAAGDYKGIVHPWLNAMRKLSFVILPACAFMFVMRREMIITLFTEAYADSVPIFAIYLFLMLAQMVLTSSVMRTIADFRFFRLKFNLIQVPLTCVALYTGIKFAGLIGAVTATVCVQVFDAAVCVTAICVKLGVKRKDLKPLAPIAGTAPAVAAAMVAAAAARMMFSPASPIIALGACAIVFGVIYMIGALLFGALTPDDQAELYNRAQPLARKVLAYVRAPGLPSPLYEKWREARLKFVTYLRSRDLTALRSRFRARTSPPQSSDPPVTSAASATSVTSTTSGTSATSGTGAASPQRSSRQTREYQSGSGPSLALDPRRLELSIALNVNVHTLRLYPERRGRYHTRPRNKRRNRSGAKGSRIRAPRRYSQFEDRGGSRIRAPRRYSQFEDRGSRIEDRGSRIED